MESSQGPSTKATHPKATTHVAGKGKGAEASKASAEEPSRAPSAARTAALETQDSKDATVDTPPPKGQGRGMTSGRTEAPSLKAQDTRMTEGPGDKNSRLMAPRTVPTKPQGHSRATARMPLPVSQGVRAPAGVRLTGATTAAVPPEKSTQATPSSAPPQSPTTQRAQRLQAANFKSEPQWDFEEEYSLDVGGLQSVSFPPPLALSPSRQAAPPPHRLHSSSHPALPHAALIPESWARPQARVRARRACSGSPGGQESLTGNSTALPLPSLRKPAQAHSPRREAFRIWMFTYVSNHTLHMGHVTHSQARPDLSHAGRCICLEG